MKLLNTQKKDNLNQIKKSLKFEKIMKHQRKTTLRQFEDDKSKYVDVLEQINK